MTLETTMLTSTRQQAEGPPGSEPAARPPTRYEMPYGQPQPKNQPIHPLLGAATPGRGRAKRRREQRRRPSAGCAPGFAEEPAEKHAGGDTGSSGDSHEHPDGGASWPPGPDIGTTDEDPEDPEGPDTRPI